MFMIMHLIDHEFDHLIVPHHDRRPVPRRPCQLRRGALRFVCFKGLAVSVYARLAQPHHVWHDRLQGVRRTALLPARPRPRLRDFPSLFDSDPTRHSSDLSPLFSKFMVSFVAQGGIETERKKPTRRSTEVESPPSALQYFSNFLR